MTFLFCRIFLVNVLQPTDTFGNVPEENRKDFGLVYIKQCKALLDKVCSVPFEPDRHKTI